MSIYDQCLMHEVARRSMTVFFLIDTSWSMRGDKIDAVNQAMRSTLNVLKQMSRENADAKIYIDVLTYSTGVHWMYESPVSVEQFDWNDIQAGGQTDFKDACIALELKLRDDVLRVNGGGAYAPVFILMADGGGTAYKTVLKRLWANSWFNHGVKAAIAIGNDVHFDMLEAFTGCAETVLRANNAAQLRSVIQFVTVQSSQIASQSSMVQNIQGQTGTSEKCHKTKIDPALRDKIVRKQDVFAQNVQALFTPVDGDDEYSEW